MKRDKLEVSDAELPSSGTEVVVSDESRLEPYIGVPKPRSAYFGWYVDDVPRTEPAPGYIAVRQRNTNCRAHIQKEFVLGGGIGGHARSFFGPALKRLDI